MGVMIFFAWRSRAGLSGTPGIVRNADPIWLSIAAIAEVISLSFIAQRWRWLLRRLGYCLGWWYLLRAYLRRKAVATIVPMGEAPAAVLFVRDLTRANVAPNDAVYSIALNGLAGTIGTTLVLIPVVFLPLVMTGGAAFGVVDVSLGFLIMAHVIGASVLVCRFRGLSGWLTRRVPKRIAELLDSAQAQNIQVRDLIKPIAFAVVSNGAGVVALYAALRSVYLRPTLATLLQARAVGSIASQFTSVFQGSGLVEGSIAAVLHHSGVATSSALAGAMLFRLVQVWLPVAIGLMMLLSLPRLNYQRVVRELPSPAYALGIATLLFVSLVSVTLSADIDEPWIAAGDGIVFAAVLGLVACSGLLLMSARRRAIPVPVEVSLPPSKRD